LVYLQILKRGIPKREIQNIFWGGFHVVRTK